MNDNHYDKEEDDILEDIQHYLMWQSRTTTSIISMKTRKKTRSASNFVKGYGGMILKKTNLENIIILYNTYG
jgi:hypothetical protein